MTFNRLFVLALFSPLGLAAQNPSETLTFQSAPLRLNTKPLFAQKTPANTPGPVTAASKPPANWRTSNEYRLSEHYAPADWQKLGSAPLTETVKAGQCRLRLAQTDRPGLYVVDLPYDFRQNDFTIDLVVEDQAPLPLAGLVYGAADKDNYYSFLVNPKGEYLVDGMVEGESLGLMPRFMKSAAIAAKGPNLLQIEKKGSQVKYLINGQSVYEGRFINFAGNKIGFYTQSPDAGFRNFTVSLKGR
ncbi:hypothetical protein [Larkinella soli]|uniref:hypothetical protein n=1 Tax=Larkinella soli TaxID=1770527 RepID=UPI000FFC1706|nr:hypothetical protein [Larkinella soli]